MSKKIDLVIVDPQVDFCDPNDGALYVKGAENDMERLANMVKRLSSKLHDIHVTLDSHHLFDVAHPMFWQNSSGKNPDPFTIITTQDLKDGKWTASIPALHGRMSQYVETLEQNGRYPLCIWPPHCLIGSTGHAVIPVLYKQLTAWEKENLAMVNYVTKGSNIYTEHYSAVCADVPDPTDPGTQINTKLIETLMDVDIIIVAGEASSHCVANSVRDIASNFSDDSYIKKLVFLTDASSPVPGFENFADDFTNEMTQRGMQVSTTTDFLA